MGDCARFLLDCPYGLQILRLLGVAALEMKVDFLNPVFGMKTVEDVVKVSSSLVSDCLLDS